MRPCTSRLQSTARLASSRVSAFTGRLNAGSARELGLELLPFMGRIDGQALVEERHHQVGGAPLREGPAEGRGDGQAALGVDPMAISPFEHSELGVFHTFFHFSTPYPTTAVAGRMRG